MLYYNVRKKYMEISYHHNGYSESLCLVVDNIDKSH